MYHTWGIKMSRDSVKSIGIGTWIITIAALLISGYTFIKLPPQLVIDVFREPLTVAGLIESNFSDDNIGRVASEEIPVLISTEQIAEIEQKKLDAFDIESVFSDEEEEVVIDDEESFMIANDFYVPEVKNIIPLNLYQVSADSDTQYNYNSSRRNKGGNEPLPRYITTETEGLLRLLVTMSFDRYYMLELVEGGYVMCLMVQDYYDWPLSKDDIKFPVGKLDYQIQVTEQKFIEEYGAVEYILVTADCEAETFKFTKILVSTVSSVLVFIVTIIIFLVIKNIFNKKNA